MATKLAVRSEKEPHHSANEVHGSEAVSKHLTQAVTDLLDLRMQVKQAHWNIAGSSFFGVHKLLDKLAEELDATIDTTAERQRSLGFITHGTARHVAKNSSLKQLAPETQAIPEVVNHLVDLYLTVGEATKEGIRLADEEEDPGTSDMLVDCLRMLDQHRYLLQSYLMPSQ